LLLPVPLVPPDPLAPLLLPDPPFLLVLEVLEVLEVQVRVLFD
jgi:hypothetical protein